jgi:hypothetical protein
MRRELRQEVGFGCPVESCAVPYLGYHHFDPPWHVEQHHRPEGMIALCGVHHPQADAGSWTAEQLRALKLRGRDRADEVRGHLNWLRRELLAVVGGNFYYETLRIFEYRSQPIIWFSRDDDGYLRLNVRMLTTSGQQRLEIIDSDWILYGEPVDAPVPVPARAG